MWIQRLALMQPVGLNFILVDKERHEPLNADKQINVLVPGLYTCLPITSMWAVYYFRLKPIDGLYCCSLSKPTSHFGLAVKKVSGKLTYG